MTSLVLLLAWGVAGRRFRSPWSRRPVRDPVAEALLVGRVLVIGLSAGLSPLDALRECVDVTRPPVRDELAGVVRRWSIVGPVSAVAGVDGMVGSLLRRMAGAVSTGAPVASLVAASLDELVRDEKTRLMARVRGMPVWLTLPLALLVLPGFLLSVIGPVVLERLDSLVGGVGG